MGFLSVFGFVLIDARLFRDVFVAITIGNRTARHLDRFRRHVDAIGSHVGDVTRFIKALGGAHGLTRAHAELAAGLLLQGGGHEGCGRIARRGFGLDGGDMQITAGDSLDRQFSLGRVVEVEFIKLFACKLGQADFKFLTCGGGYDGLDAPEFAGAEGFDLHLAFANDAQGNRLHAACGFCTGQLSPQNGAEVKAHKIVQCTAGEVCLDQRHVHLARVFHGLGHGVFGDRVEHNAADRRVFLDRLAQCERLLEVPADRFAFAVGVGCEDQFVVEFQRVGNRLHVLFRAAVDFPKHLEIIVGID